MLCRLASIPCSFQSLCSAGSALRFQRESVTRLYTSYFPGRLFPTQMVRPRQRLLDAERRMWCKRRQRMGDKTGDSAAVCELEGEKKTDASSLALGETPRPTRSYFPLREVAKMELQGDYLTEGGMHQEALENYGVVAKAYELAYPENHSQRQGILIKLSGALRRTGRLQSSKNILLSVFKMMEGSTEPHIELIVEALLELGLTEEAMGEGCAGETFEEAVRVVEEFHNFGASHKMLRLLPKLSRRFNLNFEEKFLYFSPFDWDRTYALADQCLHRATEFYKKSGNREGATRVLQTRVNLLSKKFFNMRDFAGKIHTMRGHWMRKARVLTDAPTPDDILRYSPTIHQVHRDFQYELTAPLGREEEVAGGINRVVLDSGNPYRRRGRHAKEMMRDAEYNYAKYTRKKEFGDSQ